MNEETLLKLLRLLVDAMPLDETADGYSERSAEQKKAEKLLKELETE